MPLCGTCGREFKSPQGLGNHRRLKHGATGREAPSTGPSTGASTRQYSPVLDSSTRQYSPVLEPSTRQYSPVLEPSTRQYSEVLELEVERLKLERERLELERSRRDVQPSTSPASIQGPAEVQEEAPPEKRRLTRDEYDQVFEAYTAEVLDSGDGKEMKKLLNVLVKSMQYETARGDRERVEYFATQIRQFLEAAAEKVRAGAS